MIWRDIENYEGYYQVSDMGSVRSLDRSFIRSNGRRCSWKGRLLSPVLNNHGYLIVNLHRNGKQRTREIHRLIAETFIERKDSKLEVRHGPNGKLDNSVDNLCWGTRSENRLDMRRDGTDGGRPVVRSDGEEFNSLSEAAEATGCSKSNISNACKGKHARIGGYWWVYKDEITKPLKFEKLRRGIKGAKPVIRGDGKIYNSAKEAAEDVRCSAGNISAACKGKYKTTKGYKWRYLN